MGWNYLSIIPKLQRCSRWSLGICPLYWACDYLSMLELKLIRVNKWWWDWSGIVWPPSEHIRPLSGHVLVPVVCWVSSSFAATVIVIFCYVQPPLAPRMSSTQLQFARVYACQIRVQWADVATFVSAAWRWRKPSNSLWATVEWARSWQIAPWSISGRTVLTRQSKAYRPAEAGKQSEGWGRTQPGPGAGAGGSDGLTSCFRSQLHGFTASMLLYLKTYLAIKYIKI